MMENSIVKDVEKIIKESIQLVEIEGRTYSNQDLRLVRHTDKAANIRFGNLSSIVSMVKNELNKFNLPLYINIENETRVSVFTSMDENKSRENPYEAYFMGNKFRFGQIYSYEDFVIAIRSLFVQNQDSIGLLELLKKVTQANSVETEDDGITQKITAQHGASLSQTIKSAPIRTLAPFRTFIEVEQPESQFLFRMRDSGSFVLFEADGGAWVRKAQENIRKYFEVNMKEEIESGKVILVG